MFADPCSRAWGLWGWNCFQPIVTSPSTILHVLITSYIPSQVLSSPCNFYSSICTTTLWVLTFYGGIRGFRGTWILSRSHKTSTRQNWDLNPGISEFKARALNPQAILCCIGLGTGLVSTSVLMNGWMVDKWMEGWTVGRMGGGVEGQIEEWMDGWMNGWRDGGIDRRMDGWLES